MKTFDKWFLVLSVLSLFIAGCLYILSSDPAWWERGIYHPPTIVHLAGTVFCCAPLVFLYFFIKYWQPVMDWYRGEAKRSFSELDNKTQNHFLTNQFCKNCQTYRSLEFERELKISGSQYILGSCKTCSSEVKVRITESTSTNGSVSCIVYKRI